MFSVINAGISNVVGDSNEKMHESKVTDRASYSTIIFKNSNKVSQPNKDVDLLLRKPVTSVHAEIRWALKVKLS